MSGVIAAVFLLLGIWLSPIASGLPPKPEPQEGKAVFDRVCSVCHGREGRGDAGPGPSLVPLEKDFNEVLGIVREGTKKAIALSRSEAFVICSSEFGGPSY